MNFPSLLAGRLRTAAPPQLAVLLAVLLTIALAGSALAQQTPPTAPGGPPSNPAENQPSANPPIQPPSSPPSNPPGTSTTPDQPTNPTDPTRRRLHRRTPPTKPTDEPNADEPNADQPNAGAASPGLQLAFGKLHRLPRRHPRPALPHSRRPPVLLHRLRRHPHRALAGSLQRAGNSPCDRRARVALHRRQLLHQQAHSDLLPAGRTNNPDQHLLPGYPIRHRQALRLHRRQQPLRDP